MQEANFRDRGLQEREAEGCNEKRPPLSVCRHANSVADGFTTVKRLVCDCLMWVRALT